MIGDQSDAAPSDELWRQASDFSRSFLPLMATISEESWKAGLPGVPIADS
jgi:hypothetical protein